MARINQEKLNGLRAKQAALRIAVERAEKAREESRAGVSLAVAAGGSTPDDWHGESTRADKELEALRLGIARMDEEIRLFRNGAALAVGKVEAARRAPAARQLAALKAERTDVLRVALDASSKGNSTGADFPARIAALEKVIASTTSELAEIDAEIVALSVD